MDVPPSAISDHQLGSSASDMPARLSAALAERYVLERELGRGGMATVFLAHDLRHGRLVALKVMHPELARALGPERFLREIQIAARLQHPNILPLFDSGTADGLPYFVTRYVDGESLRARVARQRQLGLADALHITREVAAALGHAHAQGIIHRDIKPENVLLTREGQVLVADFGIARAVDAAAGEKLTETGLALGTPAYMSPEQAAGDGQLDGRSDIYALGCVLYEMLAGEPPFSGRTAQAMLARHALDPVPSLRTVRSAVPLPVEHAITKALAKVPADRFATADEFVAALERAEGAAGIPPRKAALRWPLLGAAAVAVLALAAGYALRPAKTVPSSPEAVAILPFRTAGASHELAWLREGMVDLLSIKLGSEGGLRTAEPASVLSAWRRAAGSEGTVISPDAALEVARSVGSGRLIDGSVVGTPEHLTITATMLMLPDGRSTAHASATGPVDSLPLLVDRLAARLLTLAAGVDPSRLSPSSSSLPATRAFLAGRVAFRQGHLDEAFRSYREATLLDSTFALAALELVHASVWVGGAWSEDAQRGKRLAQAGRNRLSAADRTLLDAWDIDDITGPESIERWETASRANPERAETWYELGDAYYHNGALVGLQDPVRLAAEAFHRGWAIDSAAGADSLTPGRSAIVAEPLTHMVEIAQMMRDTASVRRLAALRLGVDSTDGTGWYLRWHRAVALGDSARRAFWADSQDVHPHAWGFIDAFINWTGLASTDLLRVTAMDTRYVEEGHPGGISSAHALALLNGGRPRETRRVLGVDDRSTENLIGRIQEALYWGGDTIAAAEAARRLSPFEAAVAPRGESGRRQIQATCALGAWHAAHGDYGSAETAIRRLRAATETGVPTNDSLPPRRDGAAGQMATLCSALLEATRSTALRLPDARSKLAQADLAARTHTHWSPMGANLVIARLAEAQGDLVLALRAVRRGGGGFMGFPRYLSTFLHEEGRLAELTGDTGGAIRAYQHYLALRPNPEPAVKPEVEQVRAELAQLVGEHVGQ
jgi:eukaryotic-like serine/threonine-protein kinase